MSESNILDSILISILKKVDSASVVNSAALDQMVVETLVEWGGSGDNDENTSDVLRREYTDHLSAFGYLTIDDGAVSLSESGREWLSNNYNQDAVENEQVSNKEDDESAVITHPYDISKLKMEPRTLSVFQVMRKIGKGEIQLNPEFQRAFVWDEVRQSKLIESILIKIPLPAFYMDATDQVNWQVIDGLQRLTTIYRFHQNKFCLEGLDFLVDLEGKKFSELPSKYHVILEDDTMLQLYNIMPGTPARTKFIIFSRVNTGGIQLTDQEIRHALNQGRITRLLHDIVVNHRFKVATQGAVETLRMSDRELALRALAFLKFGYPYYKGFSDLSTFLMASMESLNNLPQEELDALADRFLSNINKVLDIFGNYAFRKFSRVGGRRSPFNKALFESWVCAVDGYDARDLAKVAYEIKQNFSNRIRFDDSYVKSISSGTGHFAAAQKRFDTAVNVIKGALNA